MPGRFTYTLLEVWDRYASRVATDSGAVMRKRSQFREGFLTGTAKTAQKRKPNGSLMRTPLGGYPIDKVNRTLLSAWVDEMVNEGLASSTIDGHWGMMGACLKFALRELEVISVNPATGDPGLTSAKRSADAHEPHIMTLPEIVKMTQSASARYRLFVETLLWSGMRMSEARALDGTDVLMDEALIVVDEATTQGEDRNTVLLKDPKTRASRRKVSVPTALLHQLNERAIGEGIPLFPGYKGGWWDERRADEVWSATRVRAGLVGDPRSFELGRRKAPTMHSCRATVTSLLFQLGATMPEVRLWVGHSDAAITLESYARADSQFRVDPVVLRVKAMGLPILEAWDRLYTETWAEYGGPVGDDDPTAAV